MRLALQGQCFARRQVEEPSRNVWPQPLSSVVHQLIAEVQPGGVADVTGNAGVPPRRQHGPQRQGAEQRVGAGFADRAVLAGLSGIVGQPEVQDVQGHPFQAELGPAGRQPGQQHRLRVQAVQRGVQHFGCPPGVYRQQQGGHPAAGQLQAVQRLGGPLTGVADWGCSGRPRRVRIRSAGWSSPRQSSARRPSRLTPCRNCPKWRPPA